MTKTKEEVRENIIKAIRSVAPEVDFNAINPDLPFRDQVDIDSMDFLNIIVRIHEALGIDIPETDYTKLATLNAFVAYISGKCHNLAN